MIWDQYHKCPPSVSLYIFEFLEVARINNQCFAAQTSTWLKQILFQITYFHMVVLMWFCIFCTIRMFCIFCIFRILVYFVNWLLFNAHECELELRRRAPKPWCAPKSACGPALLFVFKGSDGLAPETAQRCPGAQCGSATRKTPSGTRPSFEVLRHNHNDHQRDPN